MYKRQPICRAGALLPQFKEEHRFDAARTVRALRLMALGLFKLVAVSDVLGLLVDEVFPNYRSYGGPMLVLAAVFYTFQPVSYTHLVYGRQRKTAAG